MAQPKTPKTRINDTMRATAIKALMIHATLDLAMALSERSDNLARRIYQEMFSPEEHKLLKKIPAGWLSTVEGLGDINAGGWKVHLSFYEKVKRPDAAALVMKNYCGHIYYNQDFKSLLAYLPYRKVVMPGRSGDYIIKDAELAAEVQQFVQDLKGHQEMCAEMLARISSTIQGFRTLENLLEAIPDLNTLAPNLQAQAIPPENALVTTAESLMCSIAKVRGEERNGCCDGERIADQPANDEQPAASVA